MKDGEAGQLPLFEFSEENVNVSRSSTESSDEMHDEFGKYIVYVDESGDHGLSSIDPNYPVFVLAFCVFHKRHYSEAIVPSLEKFKFNYFGHDQVVLHEHEIRKEKGAFSFFKNRDHKNQFMTGLSGIVEKSNFILISCTIDKRELKKQNGNKSNPYHLALRFCMESLYEFLQEKGEENKKTHVVVECRGKKEDRELELEFRRICDGSNQAGIQLPFDVVFSDKKTMSSGLQLADLVARPIGLKVIRKEQRNKAFDILKKKFYCDGGREDAGDGYEGRGMKVYPET